MINQSADRNDLMCKLRVYVWQFKIVLWNYHVILSQKANSLESYQIYTYLPNRYEPFLTKNVCTFLTQPFKTFYVNHQKVLKFGERRKDDSHGV